MNSSSASPSFEWGLEGHGGGIPFEPVALFDPANGEASLLEEVREEAAKHKNEEEEGQEGSSSNVTSTSSNKRPSEEEDENWPVDIPAVSRRKKKPKGLPNRPLSAYNLFFQKERPKLLQGDDGKRLSCEELGKIIGKRWRALSASEREEYESLAMKDSLRYRDEMEAFNEDKKKRIADMDKLDDRFPVETASDLHPSPAPPSQLSHARKHGGYVPPESDPRVERGRADFPSPSEDPRGMEPSHFGRPSFSGRPPPSHPHPYQFHGEQPPRSSPYFPPPWSAHQAQHPPVDANLFPIPPGMELMLPDRDGRERKYRVQYACYTMPREAAQQYIEQLAGRMPFAHHHHHQPYPPPPYHHHTEENRGGPPPPPHCAARPR